MAATTRFPSLCHGTPNSSPAPPGTGVGLWVLAGTRDKSQCLWEIHRGHLHQEGKGKITEPRKPGQCLCAQYWPPSLPPSCPWDYKLHEAKSSLLPMGFSKAQCPLCMEQVWAVERARRRRKNVKSIFSLLAELFDLDIAFLRITEILIK